MNHPVINSGACGNPGQAARRKFYKQGFALVVTLSLMILLTVIALGLLGLSSVSLRASGQSAAIQKARANAQMAMMLAIGELQLQMGPDQRISADAAILDSSTPSTMENSHWMGAWNSWYAGVRGVDTPSDHRSGSVGAAGMAPTYVTNRKDHFSSWLVSLVLPTDAKDMTAASRLKLSKATTSPTKNDTAVQLVGKGSLGTTATTTDFVNAQLINLAPKAGGTVTGRYAWWVGDESQKARIVGDSYALSDKLTMADRIFRHQAPGSTATNSVPGLEDVDKTDKADTRKDNADQLKLTYVPSLKSLGLLNAKSKQVPAKNFHSITPYSCQVLSDVREGGLKRDLSTLLERNISTGETSAPFLLYKLGNESVPIQDLAAYYQLYRNKGTQYSSNVLRAGIQTTTPDINSSAALREEYSNLYRMAVPIRIQFELSLIAKPRVLSTPPTVNKDTHMLHIGIAPAVTLWNPYNVPLTMNFGNPATKSSMMRMFGVPLLFKWNKNGTFITTGVTLGDVVDDANNGFSLFFSGQQPIVFEPGEVIVFSMKPGIAALKSTDTWTSNLEAIRDWDANSFLTMPRSATRAQFLADQPPRVPGSPNPTESRNFDQTGGDYSLTFKDGDNLSVSIEATGSSNNVAFGDPAFEFFLRPSAMKNSPGDQAMSRLFQMNSRKGASNPAQAAFNKQLVSKGFPGGASVIPFGSAIPVKTLIRKSSRPPVQSTPFLQFTLEAGAEKSTSGGSGFVSRPFLHSTAITGGSIIDSLDTKSLYLNGWNWTVNKVTSGFAALVETGAKGNGYYGGGYTSSTGSTNVVQQEIPVAPPISIAALSHAQLGGFSIATAPLGTRPADWSTNLQNTTASGNGGLFPRTLQAIGNSYAHPFLRPNEAFGKWTREIVAGASKSVDFADHSYLANKALWDEYFFSSITPANTKIFERNSSAAQVAKDFFFNEKPLPNHRMVPYLNGFDEKALSKLLTTAKSTDDGCFADQIASHLMVQGAFNVNSTSIDAWKTFLKSLKDKKIYYLGMSRSITDNAVKLYPYPDPADKKPPLAPGVPISSFSLPNGRTYQGSPTNTSDQTSWTDWRQLSDKEIDELASAIVKQVKLRGPFLSLSEFVNRRLDSSNKDLSLKGALQAAIDDTSINSGFKTRPKISSAAVSGAAFPEALDGPVAYGSSVYVDQADLLRNCAELLAPRGDTFVIRTYGDALDANGNIQARAWCEAVVQRVPEYVLPEDLPYLKPNDSRVSGISETFGRRIQIISMRYLTKDEI